MDIGEMLSFLHSSCALAFIYGQSLVGNFGCLFICDCLSRSLSFLCNRLLTQSEGAVRYDANFIPLELFFVLPITIRYLG